MRRNEDSVGLYAITVPSILQKMSLMQPLNIYKNNYLQLQCLLLYLYSTPTTKAI